MPKIPPLTSRKVIAILEKKGFTLVRTKGSHHIFRNEDTGRQVTIPVHAGDLPQGTLHEIVRQAGLSRDDILDE